MTIDSSFETQNSRGDQVIGSSNGFCLILPLLFDVVQCTPIDSNPKGMNPFVIQVQYLKLTKQLLKGTRTLASLQGFRMDLRRIQQGFGPGPEPVVCRPGLLLLQDVCLACGRGRLLLQPPLICNLPLGVTLPVGMQATSINPHTGRLCIILQCCRLRLVPLER